MIAVDDGLFNGNFNLADIFFLVAVIIFLVEFVLIETKHAAPFVLMPLGLASGFLGLLVL